MSTIKMPKTGLPLEQAEDKDLLYWAERKEKEVAGGSSKYPDRDARDAKEMRAELARRKAGGAKPAATKPAPSTALAPARNAQLAGPSQSVAGGFLSANVADAKLREAADNFHLVSPATSCGSLPLGCEVAISLVHVNPSTDRNGPGDVAPVGGGKLSLSGNVLKKIAAAAGVDWDPNLSRRLDNARDPHYCHFRAVGTVRLFDGSVRTVTGEVEIDMREGSPQIEAMKARAKDGANIDSQIRDTRLFLLRHAETKAKLRAIADMGVKRSYTVAELDKPFAVARLMFTGKTSDPEMTRMMAGKIADHMLGGSRALYGGGQEPPRLPSGRDAPLPNSQMPPVLPGHDAPPVGAVAGEDSDYEAVGEPVADAVGTPLPTGQQQPANQGDAYEDDLAEEAKASGAY